MKLLTKNEIAKAQAIDRAQEIAEGKKISGRVDSLRELMAKEELILAKFRDESLAEIHTKTTQAAEELEDILKEIQDLRAERERGLKDVAQEKASNEEFKKQLDQFQETLLAARRDLEANQLSTNATRQEILNESERARTHTEQAQKLHAEAESYRASAKSALENASLIEKTALEKKGQIEKEVALSLETLSLREESMTAREESVATREKELEVQRIQLADQWGQLQRAQERFKKTGEL